MDSNEKNHLGTILAQLKSIKELANKDSRNPGVLIPMLQRIIDHRDGFDCELWDYCPSHKPTLNPPPHYLFEGRIPIFCWEDPLCFNFEEDLNIWIDFKKNKRGWKFFSNDIIWGKYGLERTCSDVIAGLIKNNITITGYEKMRAHFFIEPQLNIGDIIQKNLIPVGYQDDYSILNTNSDIHANSEFNRGNNEGEDRNVTFRSFIPSDFSSILSRNFEYAKAVGLDWGVDFQKANLYHALTTIIAWHYIGNNDPSYLRGSVISLDTGNFAINTYEGYTVVYILQDPRQESIPGIPSLAAPRIIIYPTKKESTEYPFNIPHYSLFVYSGC